MKLYIVDDDNNIQTLLKMIIEQRSLGTLCGAASNGVDALDDLLHARPDIVIVDLLMPEMDGISFVKKARPLLPDTAFIMLSQVASKDMIADAYTSGVEFYIQKPINSIEVENVVRRVEQSLTARRTLKQVQHIFSNQTPSLGTDTPPKPYLSRLRTILQQLGIVGEKGSRDIIQLITFLAENTVGDSSADLNNTTLSDLCSNFSDNPKSVEQRIRRAANSGMVNLANLGLEDYSNDIFGRYANTLYNFEQIRREMDYIRGKSNTRGNVKIKSFLNALLLTCMEP